jgi:hypothetical protein
VNVRRERLLKLSRGLIKRRKEIRRLLENNRSQKGLV